ncbi:MAG: hypothetical protein LBC19_07435, partial [Tannerella sp.]|nr:hypothetical protein [Tannerella sp.]
LLKMLTYPGMRAFSVVGWQNTSPVNGDGYLQTTPYSHRMVGWKLSRRLLTLRSSGALSALKMALGSLSGKVAERACGIIFY